MLTTARTITSPLAVWAKFFRGLADLSCPGRLEAPRGGEGTVGELVLPTGLSHSNVSGHLARLREGSLVETRQQSRHVYYRLAGPYLAQRLREADRELNVIAQPLAACTRPQAEAGR